MTENDDLFSAVDQALTETMQRSNALHPTVPVKEAADLVMEKTKAPPDQRGTIVQKVCETSIKRRYVLAFRQD